MLTLEELALVGFSPTHDVQPFEVADGVKTGSILFLHRSDGMLHHDPGEGAPPIGVTTSDLAPHSVIRPPFLPSWAVNQPFQKELAMLTGKAARWLACPGSSGSRKTCARTESRLDVAFGVRLSLAVINGTQLDQLAVIFWGPGSIALRGIQIPRSSENTRGKQLCGCLSKLMPEYLFNLANRTIWHPTHFSFQRGTAGRFVA